METFWTRQKRPVEESRIALVRSRLRWDSGKLLTFDNFPNKTSDVAWEGRTLDVGNKI